MIRLKITCCLLLLFCFSCKNKTQHLSSYIYPSSSHLEEILQKGSLDISTFYNTTDYYIYKGITRGFHYELAQDFANYLGVKLQIIEVNNNMDTAIQRLQNKRYDLLALSLTQTSNRKKILHFSQPLFHTGEVLVQHKNLSPISNLKDLHGKEIFIPQSAHSYKKILQNIQDSLHIHINIRESKQYNYEDLLHLVEKGEIAYTIVDENIAQAKHFTLKNIDYSIKLQDSISISWATPLGSKELTNEINLWLKQLQKSGKLNYLYKRYFKNPNSVPKSVSKYNLLKKGQISPFDSLIKEQSKRLGWDWRFLAALIFVESKFDPTAQSHLGAYGLMQIIPETAEQFKVTNYFQTDSNIYVGVSFLQYLDNFLRPHVSDSTERVKFVLASYNAGAGHILDAMRLASKYGKNPQIWKNNVDYFLLHKNEPKYYQDSLVKNGYCNGTQSYQYVERIFETYNNYKNIK